MNESGNIRDYVENLFSSAPQTKKVLELKEELLVNLNEKYNDLIQKGYNENDAYKNVIRGIGAIDELIEGVRLENPFIRNEETQRQRKLKALMMTLAVGLYFLAFVVMLFPSFLTVPPENKLPASVTLVGIATCLVVFVSFSFPKHKKYRKIDNTIVEQFKEWKINKEKSEKIYASLSSILWCATTLVYFLFSFTFGYWHVSWLIFILATIVQLFLDMVMHWDGGISNKKSRERIMGDLSGILWVAITFLYFAISFLFGNWHISWIIFLIATVIQVIVKMLFDMFD